MDSGSIFHFLHHCGIGDFWTFVSISYTISGQFVPYLAKWLDADKKHLQRFGTDATDIQIRINRKIWIQILDHFQLKFWHWQRFVLSDCSCYYCYYAQTDTKWCTSPCPWYCSFSWYLAKEWKISTILWASTEQTRTSATLNNWKHNQETAKKTVVQIYEHEIYIHSLNRQTPVCSLHELHILLILVKITNGKTCKWYFNPQNGQRISVNQQFI